MAHFQKNRFSALRPEYFWIDPRFPRANQPSKISLYILIQSVFSETELRFES